MMKEMLESIQKELVYAIIPARSGSKGITNKNIYNLGGFPVIAYSIAAATLTGNINRVIVSTDSVEYTEIAKSYGAETPFIRPKEFATDMSTDLEFMCHAIEWFYENEKLLPEFFVHLRPTTPLRSVMTIEKAIEKIKKMPQASSLRSGHITNDCPYKWLKLDATGNYFKSLFDGFTVDDANEPRQTFPNVYIPNGHVDVLKTEYIINYDRMHGDNVAALCLSDTVDIDYQEDLIALENTLNNSDNEIFLYLRERYGIFSQ